MLFSVEVPPEAFEQICAPAESDTAAIAIKVTGQSSAAIANLVTCNQLCVKRIRHMLSLTEKLRGCARGPREPVSTCRAQSGVGGLRRDQFPLLRRLSDSLSHALIC